MNGDRKTEEQLAAALRAAEVIIGYTPIGDEPHFKDFLKEKNDTATVVLLPPKRELSPQDAAKQFIAAYAQKKVLLFIPGREFDANGTRHGRGGGWYDRFLHDIPREWLRIGTLNASQLSEKPLLREPWDEPMDVLLITNGPDWKTIIVR